MYTLRSLYILVTLFSVYILNLDLVVIFVVLQVLVRVLLQNRVFVPYDGVGVVSVFSPQYTLAKKKQIVVVAIMSSLQFFVCNLMLNVY
jgi:hypothetical protein